MLRSTTASAAMMLRARSVQARRLLGVAVLLRVAPPALLHPPCAAVACRSFTAAASSAPPAASASAATAAAPRTLLLIDASGIMFRQYFGYKNRTAPMLAEIDDDAGDAAADPLASASAAADSLPAASSSPSSPSPSSRDVGALYGYASSILNLCATLRPSHVAACMDVGASSSFRRALFAGYKAERKPVEDALKWQLARLRDVTHSLGITPLRAEGFEADDLIGTLARRACEGHEGSSSVPPPPFDRVVILSNDKDFIQCLRPGGDGGGANSSATPSVSMLSPKNGSGASYVWTHYSDASAESGGVAPERFVDYLVLLGDAVDGIPGVERVGARTAQKLLAAYPSLPALLSAARQGPVGGSKLVSQALLAAEGDLPVWTTLATIKTDLPDDVLGTGADRGWEGLKYKGPTVDSAGQAADSTESSGAAMSIRRVLDLFRRFNFPPPPAFCFAPAPADDPSTPSVLTIGSDGSFASAPPAPAASPSSTASTLRYFTQAEWLVGPGAPKSAAVAKRKTKASLAVNDSAGVASTLEVEVEGAVTEKKPRAKRTKKAAAPTAIATEVQE